MERSPNNLYDILNIPESIILDKAQDVHYWISLSDESSAARDSLNYLNNALGLVNKFHSYFHFEQSFAYNICAYIYHLKEEHDLKTKYLDKSIFQDHINHHALQFDDLITAESSTKNHLSLLMSYDKNYRYEESFLLFAIGDFEDSTEIKTLDMALRALFEKEVTNAKRVLSDLKYRSHRADVARAIIEVFEANYDGALEAILKTLQKMEEAHQLYHEFASDVYLKRAATFEALGEVDLAKNDRVKAHDLFPQRELELPA